MQSKGLQMATWKRLTAPDLVNAAIAKDVSLPKTLSNLTRGHRRNQSKIAE
jgi:hypothetical protein